MAIENNVFSKNVSKKFVSEELNKVDIWICG